MSISISTKRNHGRKRLQTDNHEYVNLIYLCL